MSANACYQQASSTILSCAAVLQNAASSQKGDLSVGIVVQVCWFIALLIAPAYSMKYVGGPKTLAVSFTVSFLLCLWMVPMTLLHAFHRYHNILSLRALLIPTFFLVQMFIYGMACWTVWKRKSSARVWAVIASLTYILIPLFAIWAGVHLSRPIRGCSVVMLVVGVTGLIVFSRRVIKYDLPTADQASA
jgi:hypothetical protein